VSFDLWPDTTELGADERCEAGSLPLPDGSPGVLFSSYHPDVVARHFRWMADHGIDGAMLRRFSSQLASPAEQAFGDTVLVNVRAGAEAHGRSWSLMYDITGTPSDDVVQRIEADWMRLVDEVGVLESDHYQAHAGRPVVGLWGFGFVDREGTAAQAQELIDFFHDPPEARYRATVVGGVPAGWRTLTGDGRPDAEWADVYAAYDVLSPWLVGRFDDSAGADAFAATTLADDLDATEARGQDYLPVVFPGFSAANLTSAGPINSIPRQGGRFLWAQVYNALDAGATMLFGATFDDLNEATALLPAAPSAQEAPAGGVFLTLDADGEILPPDWYLQLAGAGAEMLRGEAPLTSQMPSPPEVKEDPEDPPPGPWDEYDDFEENDITWLHTDVSGWDVTSSVTAAHINYDELCIFHTMAGLWPEVLGIFSEDPDAPMEGNLWIIARVDGVWYAATFDYLRPGGECKYDGYGPDDEGPGPATFGAVPLSTWVPQTGEPVWMFVSTVARHKPLGPLSERSDYVQLLWP
jgi:hypothetical protein